MTCAPNRAFPTVGESEFGNTVEATPLQCRQNVHAHARREAARPLSCTWQHRLRPAGLRLCAELIAIA